MHNFKLKKMQFKQFIDDIAIDIWFFKNFARMEDISWKYNQIVDLSKFTFNKNILSKIVTISYNQSNFIINFCPFHY